MSIEHMAMVFAADGLTSSEKVLLLAYTNHTDAHGYCYQGMTRLAAETALSESTIKRVRKGLESKHLLKHKRRVTESGDATSNVYRVNLPKLRAMGRDQRDFDDDIMALEFTDDTPSDQPIVHHDPTPLQDGPTPGHHEPTGGVMVDPPWGHHDPLSLIDPSPDPSIEADAGLVVEGESDPPPGEGPSTAAMGLVCGLSFGEHRRPSRREAVELARLVDSAVASGLPLVQVRRHAQAKLNEARVNAVAYLRGGLGVDNLPVPEPAHSGQPARAAPGSVASEQHRRAVRERCGLPRGQTYQKLVRTDTA